MTETIVNSQLSIDNTIEFPPWFGEFGWEVASWVPYCRKKAEGYKEVIVTSYDGMAPLYADFATEFRSHGHIGRGLDYPKNYRPEGKYYKYGGAKPAGGYFDCLIHARGIRRKSSINYRQWDRFIELKKKSLPYTCACIGSDQDQTINGLIDLRRIGLQELMDHMAAAKVVIGVSSGIMHLAAFCGTDIVTWGDRRTYFSETLEQRYKITWNPFNIKVGWIDADDFQPAPQQILGKVKELLNYDREDFIKKYPTTAW